MRARQPVPKGLTILAELQAGVLTREQVLGHHFNEPGIARMLKAGSWQRVSPGVYFTASSPPPWTALAWAGVLIGGNEARLGGLAAAHMHRLHAPEPAEITVLVPARRGAPEVTGPWRFRRERPGARSARTVGSPPRLTVEDTVLDLVSDDRWDASAAVSWVTAAVQARVTTPERILKAMSHRRFVAHRRLLISLLADVAEGARSPLELAYLRKVERPHGLPVGRRQVRHRNTEIDVLYEEYALVVELDGRLGHTGAGRFRDMRRDNAATTDGLATLRYGHHDVEGLPCHVARQVGHTLSLRGWPGPLLQCGAC